MVSEVEFHSGVPDKLAHACRLLRKAWRKGARVIVGADMATLARLDQALWTFEPLEFVPHALLRRGGAVPARLARTPIWLVEPGAAPPYRDVLVNLGPEMADAYAVYARVIEIVGADADDRAAGRRRWRAYETAGVPLRHHRFAAGGEGG